MEYINKLKIGIISPSKDKLRSFEKNINSYFINATNPEYINVFLLFRYREKFFNTYELIIAKKILKY